MERYYLGEVSKMDLIPTNGNRQDKLLSFLRSEKFVDCTFRIEGHEVRAHKLILACSSPVFEKMFFGELASTEVDLLDVKVSEFRQMLDFVYTNDITFTSIVNAWSLFCIAQKYLMQDLIELCLGYISRNLTMSTLALSYEYSELFNLDRMKRQCFDDMVDMLPAVLASDYHVKSSTLRSILGDSSSSSITEIDLMCKIVEWATKECEFRGQLPVPKTVTDVLVEEGLLRFVSKSWLSDSICEYCNDYLLMCQCVDELTRDTLMYLDGEDDQRWSDSKILVSSSKNNGRRFKLAQLVPAACKTRKVYKIARRLDLQPNEEFVSSVSVNRETIVSGLFVCTEMNYAFGTPDEYKGSMTIRFCELDSNESIVKPTVMNDVFPYNSQVFVPLRYAVTLRPDQLYDVRISFKNYCSEKVSSSIVCSYMSEEVVDQKRGYSKMYFYDFFGTIIKGVAYYPV